MARSPSPPSDEKTLREAVGAGRAQELLPVLCFRDEGGFSTRVQEGLARCVGEERAQLIQWGHFPDTVATARGVFSAGFRARIHPIRLWEDQATWCVWFLSDAEDKSLEAYRQARQALERAIPQGFQHLVFARVKGKAVGHLGQLAGEGTFVFVLSDQDQDQVLLDRPEELLAEGVAVYLAGAWLTYCRNRDGRIRDALMLSSENSNCYSLGVGSDAPDLGYHTGVVAPGLVLKLRDAWVNLPSVQEIISPYAGHEEDLRSCLPAEFYDLKKKYALNSKEKEDSREEAPQVELSLAAAGESLLLGYREGKRTPGFMARTVREGWGRRLALLRKLDDFMRSFVLRSAELCIAGRVREFVKTFRARYDAFLVLADRPEGLFPDLRQRLKLSRDYLYGLGTIQVRTPEGVDPLDANIQKLIQRIRSIPSLPGVVLRVALIVTGLVWMVLGILLWTAPGTGRPDLCLCLMFVVCASLVILLPLVVLAEWWIPSRGTEKAEVFARRDIACLHLVDTGCYLGSRFADGSRPLDTELKAREEKAEALEKGIRERRDDCSGIPAKANANRRFEASASMALTQEAEESLIAKIHARVKTVLEGEGWPDSQPERWIALSGEKAAEVAGEFLRERIYDQWAEAAQLSEEDRRQIVHDVIRDARTPAFPAGRDYNIRVVLVASQSWAACRGEDDTTLVWDWVPPRRDLMALAPIAIDLEGDAGGGERP